MTLVKPAIPLWKEIQSEKHCTTEVLDFKLEGKIPMRLNFQWSKLKSDEAEAATEAGAAEEQEYHCFLQLHCNEPTILRMRLDAYLESRSVGNKMILDQKAVLVEGDKDSFVHLGRHSFFKRHCFSKKDEANVKVRRVKAQLVLKFTLTSSDKMKE